MPYIGPNPAEQFTSFATQEFSTSATTSYTLDHAVTNENEIALFVNNVRQQPGSGKAYTATGTALTLSAATASTDTMYCVFLGRALQTVNPATNSISTTMISDNAVTSAKISASLGKVLQVQSVYTDNVFSTTSSSFVDVTNVTVNITPSATSSKVLLWLNGYISNSTSSTNRCRLLRDSTDLAPGADGNGFYEANLELFSSQHTALQLCFLDSPSTTSQVTYKLQTLRDAGTIYIGSRPGGANQCSTTLTVMEIGA